MSSHHIIREHQEPALYVHDWKESFRDIFGQLCEWSPKIYTNANTDLILRDLGVKVDECLGDVIDPLDAAIELRKNIEHVNVLCSQVDLIVGVTEEALVLVNDCERAYYRADGHAKWYAERQGYAVKMGEGKWSAFFGSSRLERFEGACWIKELF
jgi:hypothetical protein